MTFSEFIESLTFEPFDMETERYDVFGTYPSSRPTQKTRDKIRPGVVVKLKNGRYVVVGHCNASRTSGSGFFTSFDFREVESIAYLWKAP